MKIVINNKHTPFDLSEQAIDLILKRKGVKVYKYYAYTIGGDYVELKKKPIQITTYYAPADRIVYLKKKLTTNTTVSWQELSTLAYTDNIQFAETIDKSDADLIYVVNKLGQDANGVNTQLKIIETERK